MLGILPPVWQHGTRMNGIQNQFSLTRAATKKGGASKSNFLSVTRCGMTAEIASSRCGLREALGGRQKQFQEGGLRHARKVTKLLIGAGANVNKGRFKPLIEAVGSGFADIVKSQAEYLGTSSSVVPLTLMERFRI